ncbi:WD40-repeat-containing domain protein [Lentinula boryana]|uniref:WD40-repeat-containing domain protein n=1 Tax=Lentinula boryana TaxID=40481 RepID=A0ABQ8QCW9_9AGAR|nr:WD40-repeat-containing domain protein [Lentinula boryana]
MLAITSTEALSILDQTVLKRTPSFVPSCMTLLSPPIASSWTSDNKLLFIASANAVHKYDVDHNSLVEIYTSSEVISTLAVKDKTSVMIGAGEKVHILECGSTTKVSQTFSSHKNTVNSLSLSSDLTLLASTSSDAAYVHNLTLASHMPLRNLPVLDQQSITTCTIHPHTRTRLLLGIGKKLVVYDINRPSGPLRVVQLSDTSSGNIGAISCSPFSKTLIAVSTTGGTLGLVDLDKEKGLFRTINVKMPLASLSFSQEGASIYLGTENGRLLILDLRVLDKPPKSIVLSETGARLATISVQAKINLATTKRPEPLKHTTSRKPSTTVSSVNKSSPSPRVTSASLKSKGLAVRSPAKDEEPIPKKVFSPLKNLLGVDNEGNSSLHHSDDFSLQIDSFSAERGVSKKTRTTPVRGTTERVRGPTLSALPNSSSHSRARDMVGGTGRLRLLPQPSPPSASVSRSKLSPKEEPSRRARTASTLSQTTTVSSLVPAVSKKVKEVPQRTRTVSTTSSRASRSARSSNATPAAGESISMTVEPKSTKGVSLTAPKDTQKTLSSSNSGSGQTGVTRSRTVSSISRSSQSRTGTEINSTSDPRPARTSRIPSPDLSDLEAKTSSGPGPMPASRRRALTTPQDNEEDYVDPLIRADEFRKDSNKGKARTVLFQDDEDDSASEQNEHKSGSHCESESEKENKREESLSWQISPRRPGSVGPSASSSMPWKTSPVRHSHLHRQYPNIPGSPGGSSPQDLLRNIVRDVMHDFHQESRAEVMGLHLDLVKIGRGWKKELRELMGEYSGELKQLREENRRLREENERFRRGY